MNLKSVYLVGMVLFFSASTVSADMSALLATVDRSMPILERLANATDEDLFLHCAGNADCIEGMRSDVVHLRNALDLMYENTQSLKDNSAALDRDLNLEGM